MQEDKLEAFLEHQGVKGMKWGVRKDVGHEGERAKTKVIAKADKTYEKSFTGMNGYVKIQNTMADYMNSHLDAMNNKPEYVAYTSKGGSLLDDSNPVTKKYLKDYEGLVEKSTSYAMDTFGSNASGTGRVKLTKVGKGAEAWFSAEWEEIKHAASGTPRFKIKPKFNSKGFITSQDIEVITTEIEHGDGIEDFLAHHGVKGMRWGRRTKGSDGRDSGRPAASVRAKQVASTVKDKYSGLSKKQKNTVLIGGLATAALGAAGAAHIAVGAAAVTVVLSAFGHQPSKALVAKGSSAIKEKAKKGHDYLKQRYPLDQD